jgi:hypothetical protein
MPSNFAHSADDSCEPRGPFEVALRYRVPTRWFPPRLEMPIAEVRRAIGHSPASTAQGTLGAGAPLESDWAPLPRTSVSSTVSTNVRAARSASQPIVLERSNRHDDDPDSQ